MRVMKAAPIVGKVKEDIDRLFDRFFSTPFATEPLFPPFESGMTEVAWMPVLDLAETEKEYVVRLEAPGFHRENLDIALRENILTITGKRDFAQEKAGETYLWREREYGRFVRSLRLPTLVVENKIEATYQDGVLNVHLPKAMPAPANKILIK